MISRKGFLVGSVALAGVGALVQDDYFFPEPRPADEIPREWKDVVADHQNRVVSWRW